MSILIIILLSIALFFLAIKFNNNQELLQLYRELCDKYEEVTIDAEKVIEGQKKLISVYKMQSDLQDHLIDTLRKENNILHFVIGGGKKNKVKKELSVLLKSDN